MNSDNDSFSFDRGNLPSSLEIPSLFVSPAENHLHFHYFPLSVVMM